MTKRINIAIRGAVQGVGFRPFVYRLAIELNIKGNIKNNSNGVFIDAESDEHSINTFIQKIKIDKPSLSYIISFEYFFLDPVGYDDFTIIESDITDDVSAVILPDIKVCPDCLREMYDKKDRRYLYPFINCTNCGPRFSIITSLPYDRKNTSMNKFHMCSQCREEYENPADRRYHAQPIACPVCGPHVELWNNKGKLISERNDAILDFVNFVRNGNILALKGIGGYQLIADASNIEIIKLLQQRKKRNDKPFALMFPDVRSVSEICHVSTHEEDLLSSIESPIVILKRKNESDSAFDFVAPGNPNLGVMLPYSPLHSLIMHELYIPVIATSGNLAEEPMCIDEDEAFERLSGIADYFLVHDRPVVRHIDDSIARIIDNRIMVSRRARGYAPLPVISSSIKANSKENNSSLLAVGAHLKNTISLKSGENIFISQHIGDLETYKANNAFEKIISDFKILYHKEPSQIVTDYHPDYYSTKYACKQLVKIKQVQHHIAHLASCRLDNQITGPALGVIWDGTGYGLDGSIWGGEFFVSNDDSCYHSGSFKQFPLLGGDIASKEPRRSALSLLYEVFGDSIFSIEPDFISENFSPYEISIFQNMLQKNINCPKTSSVGRLFDAVSSLAGICQTNNYEGQAAMMLEFAASTNENGSYKFELEGNKFISVDWKPIIESILDDLKNNIRVDIISAKFHNTLSEIILMVAKYFKIEKVLLSGGCFQNSLLLTKAFSLLEKNNFRPYRNQRIPTNDGGISVGQIVAADWIIGSYLNNENIVG